MSLAPLVADGKVLVGASGGELGIRGFVAALRRRDRQAAVEDLHRAGAGRARQRNVAGRRRSVEDRRRLGLGDRQLRSRDEPRVLGHRQRRTVDGRPAARRQPLHRVDDRHRRRHRRDQGAPSVQPERIVGLGRGVAADPGRLPRGRPDDQRADRRRAQRLPLVPRADERPIKFVDAQAVREAERLPRRRSEDRPARRRSWRESRAPARRPSSARRSGAARTGRRSRSARARG